MSLIIQPIMEQNDFDLFRAKEESANKHFNTTTYTGTDACVNNRRGSSMEEIALDDEVILYGKDQYQLEETFNSDDDDDDNDDDNDDNNVITTNDHKILGSTEIKTKLEPEPDNTLNFKARGRKGKNIVKLFKSLRRRRRRARTHLDANKLTESDLRKLDDDVRNDDRRMNKMKSSIATTMSGDGGGTGGGKLAIRKGVNQLTMAALAPKAFLDKVIVQDIEDGMENLGFYHPVAITGDESFDSWNEEDIEHIYYEESAPRDAITDFMFGYDSCEIFDNGYRQVSG